MIEKIGIGDVSIEEMMSREIIYCLYDVRDYAARAVEKAYVEGYNDAIDAMAQKMGESTTETQKPLESLTGRERARLKCGGL